MTKCITGSRLKPGAKRYKVPPGLPRDGQTERRSENPEGLGSGQPQGLSLGTLTTSVHAKSWLRS
jgi:hypothetical protein